MHSLPIRLHPDEDLRPALEARVRREVPTGSAFVVSGIGSLVDARLRLAGAAAEAVIAGDVEILSLSGTVSPAGSHLHIAVADAQGRVHGGHLCPGSRVRTTVELLLAWDEAWRLDRAQDAQTGYQELVVRPGGKPAR